MNIMIDIECDQIDELVSHLYKLIEQVKKQKKVNKVEWDDDFPVGTCLADDNCYGSHELNVIELIKTNSYG